MSEDDLRNTLLLDILHDTNVEGEHIEKLVTLISNKERVAELRAFEKAKSYFVGFNTNVIDWINDDMAKLHKELSPSTINNIEEGER